ncbi:MAG: hypothetical protein LBJ02_00105 [Bifidobacteriaceae bacterium]|jgi:hypothetical protein|nr:hypothetical protein [Bifidobacteriaceae bacterium]
MTTTEHAPRLTALDRCDRCGARAYYRATLMSGELLFCGHHGRAALVSLKGQALRIDDFTAELAADASSNLNAQEGQGRSAH